MFNLRWCEDGLVPAGSEAKETLANVSVVRVCPRLSLDAQQCLEGEGRSNRGQAESRHGGAVA